MRFGNNPKQHKNADISPDLIDYMRETMPCNTAKQGW